MLYWDPCSGTTLFMPVEEGMTSLYVEVSLELKAKQSCTQANLRQLSGGDGSDSKSSPGPIACVRHQLVAYHSE